MAESTPQVGGSTGDGEPASPADMPAVDPAPPPTERPTDDDAGRWTDWVAIPHYSGFRVLDPKGRVRLAQTGTEDFVVGTTFAFVDEPTISAYVERVLKAGEKQGRTRDQASDMVEDARALTAGEQATDLASVPQFMAWFERAYGRHTLAAILHDDLIKDPPNSGALGSDTLADSFFRDMMGVAGVPFFKRWLMWAAVAARTRWYAGFHRRLFVALWAVCALAGVSAAFLGAASVVADLGWWDRPGLWLGLAVLLPFASAPFWGRQYGASLVAAAAGAWLVPAAAFVFIGLVVYRVSEWFVGAVIGYDKRQEPATVLLPTAPPPVSSSI